MGVSAHLYAQLHKRLNGNGSATRELSTMLELLDGPVNNWFVNSATGSDSTSGEGWDAALATIDAAINKCSPSDRIHVAPGHVDSLATGVTIDADVAGIEIIGYGKGSQRPRIDYDGTSSLFSIGASGVSLSNITFRPSVAAVVIGVDIEASSTDVSIVDCEFLPGEAGDGTDEFVLGIDVKAGCSRTHLERIKYSHHASAGASQACIKLTGASDRVYIGDCWLEISGAAAVACIQQDTTLCTRLLIEKCVLTTDAEPGIELLTGTTGMLRDIDIFGDLATIAAAVVSDGCAFNRVTYTEVGNELGAATLRTASADD